MSGSDVWQRDRLAQFAGGRPHWRMHEQGDRPYAGRLFEYPSGAALLSVKQVNPERWFLDLFDAQVNIAFSAGPEDSITGCLDDCVGWVVAKEPVLQVPVLLTRCSSLGQVREVIEPVKLRDLRLLARVLELRSSGGVETLRQRIVAHVCRARPRLMLQAAAHYDRKGA